MAREKKATAFVTGADGFFGTALLKVLVADGHRVFGLAPSLAAAERVRRAGGQAVIGDLEQGLRQVLEALTE
jgi:nucleoside-diphosphate-sugar epimerase